MFKIKKLVIYIAIIVIILGLVSTGAYFLHQAYVKVINYLVEVGELAKTELNTLRNIENDIDALRSLLERQEIRELEEMENLRTTLLETQKALEISRLQARNFALLTLLSIEAFESLFGLRKLDPEEHLKEMQEIVKRIDDPYISKHFGILMKKRRWIDLLEFYMKVYRYYHNILLGSS